MTGEKIRKITKFECEICGYTSKHETSVEEHIGTAHNEN